jgi:dipeptidyl aminopeptidase/acylaminoacyl peptidase
LVVRFAPALVLVPIAALVAAGCGGGGRSASGRQAGSLSTRCTARPDASSSANLLWLGGRQRDVYYVDGGRVVSSHGRVPALPAFATPVGFRACRTPLLLYRLGDELRAAPLTAGRKTLSLGRNAVVASDGQLVSFAGAQVRYDVGYSFEVRGLPPRWEIVSLAVSPRSPRVLLAATQSPKAGIETCGKLGRIYRITPTGSRTILVDNPCRDKPEIAWSPNGSSISYITGESNDLHVLDSNGSHPRRIAVEGRIRKYLWSPDGSRIAYVTTAGEAAVVNVSSGVVHVLGRGALLAWSPDGHEIALAAAGKPLIEAVSASGGSAHVLLRLGRS